MKRTSCLFFFSAIYLLVLITPASQKAQKRIINDTSYYETFPDKVTLRLYTSQKYVHLNFPTKTTNVRELEYKANTNMNLGAGFSYHNLSLNLFYGFGFLNKDDAKGKTKGLDIQLHVYPRKWAIDLYGIFPKGFHVDPKGYAAANANSYYYRPDIKLSTVGVSAYRVPNKERFSYRAAITQNEWQKKSAGSVLFGGEFFSGTLKGDSVLIPKSVQNNYPQAGITKVNFLRFGPGIGYAYTLVIDQHFFITGSMVGNLDLSFTTEQSSSKNNKFALSPTTVFKAAIGYNSRTWNVSANWTGNAMWIRGASSDQKYFWPVGNYRVVLATRVGGKKHHAA